MGLPMQAENLFWYITVSEECPNKKNKYVTAMYGGLSPPIAVYAT